jgi:hypothetical protein
LASQWWIETACSAAGIAYHYNDVGGFYHRYVGCWANPYYAVNTGSLGYSIDFRVVLDGTNGAAGKVKYFWVSCDTWFGIEVCDWENKTYTTNAGFWRALRFDGYRERAAEYSNPNAGYFAIKFNAPYEFLSHPLACSSPQVDCIYHNQ